KSAPVSSCSQRYLFHVCNRSLIHASAHSFSVTCASGSLRGRGFTTSCSTFLQRAFHSKCRYKHRICHVDEKISAWQRVCTWAALDQQLHKCRKDSSYFKWTGLESRIF